MSSCIEYLKVSVAPGNVAQEDQGVRLTHEQGLVLGSCRSAVPSLSPVAAPFLCVVCLCYLHTPMAITSSSSSRRKRERPASPPGCVSLALPFPFCSGCGEPFLLTLAPSQQRFSSCASLVDGVLPFEPLCFRVPLSSAPLYHPSV